jgi:hypothetical protein
MKVITGLTFWQPLADQGDAAAQNKIGEMYMNGQGVTQDYAEAMNWYRKAADQGDADAQLNIGRMYESGEGVMQDYKQAAEWFRKAADQGDADAQRALGGMYEMGQGVTQDNVQAYMWYSIVGVEDRDRLEKEMTTEQIAEADRLVAAWKPTPAAKP